MTEREELSTKWVEENQMMTWMDDEFEVVPEQEPWLHVLAGLLLLVAICLGLIFLAAGLA